MPERPHIEIKFWCSAIYSCFLVQSPKRILERCYSEQNNCNTEEGVVNRLWRFFGFIIAIHGVSTSSRGGLDSKIWRREGLTRCLKMGQNENHSERNQQHRSIIIDVPKSRPFSSNANGRHQWHKQPRCLNQIRTPCPNDCNSNYTCQYDGLR